MTCAMASTDACGGPSGNSFPLIHTVSAGATPESLARCANAASVRPAAIIPAKALRENMSCSYRLKFCGILCRTTLAAEVDGEGKRADRPGIRSWMKNSIANRAAGKDKANETFVTRAGAASRKILAPAAGERYLLHGGFYA